MRQKIILACFLIAAALIGSTSTFGKGAVADLIQSAVQAAQIGTFVAPASGQVEVAFAPNEGAEELVLKVIGSAKSSIRVAAYSFTSPSVVAALVKAHKRGVDVKVVMDHKNNFVEGCGPGKPCKGRHAAQTLASAGISVRSISKYAIHHQKFICVDMIHVENGSFNYSQAAATRNAENVLVNWNNPVLAKAFNAKWEQYWAEGSDPL